MSYEELIALIESVLEMDEQADRSIALDRTREAVGAMNLQTNNLTEEVERLSEVTNNLTARNNELFLQVGSSTKPQETPQKPENPSKVFEDASLFE